MFVHRRRYQRLTSRSTLCFRHRHHQKMACGRLNTSLLLVLAIATSIAMARIRPCGFRCSCDDETMSCRGALPRVMLGSSQNFPETIKKLHFTNSIDNGCVVLLPIMRIMAPPMTSIRFKYVQHIDRSCSDYHMWTGNQYNVKVFGEFIHNVSVTANVTAVVVDTTMTPTVTTEMIENVTATRALISPALPTTTSVPTTCITVAPSTVSTTTTTMKMKTAAPTTASTTTTTMKTKTVVPITASTTTAPTTASTTTAPSTTTKKPSPAFMKKKTQTAAVEQAQKLTMANANEWQSTIVQVDVSIRRSPSRITCYYTNKTIAAAWDKVKNVKFNAEKSFHGILMPLFFVTGPFPCHFDIGYIRGTSVAIPDDSSMNDFSMYSDANSGGGGGSSMSLSDSVNTEMVPYGGGGGGGSGGDSMLPFKRSPVGSAIIPYEKSVSACTCIEPSKRVWFDATLNQPILGCVCESPKYQPVFHQNEIAAGAVESFFLGFFYYWPYMLSVAGVCFFFYLAKLFGWKKTQQGLDNVSQSMHVADFENQNSANAVAQYSVEQPLSRRNSQSSVGSNEARCDSRLQAVPIDFHRSVSGDEIDIHRANAVSAIRRIAPQKLGLSPSRGGGGRFRRSSPNDEYDDDDYMVSGNAMKRVRPLPYSPLAHSSPKVKTSIVSIPLIDVASEPKKTPPTPPFSTVSGVVDLAGIQIYNPSLSQPEDKPPTPEKNTDQQRVVTDEKNE